MSARNVQVTLDMSGEAYAMLDRLAGEARRTPSDILRLALAMMSVAIPALKEGKHVGIASDSNKLDAEFLGIVN